jgi:hypothetical protein
MTKDDELQLFARLATEPKLREWLMHKLSEEHKVLTVALEEDTFRRSQGRAGLLDLILKLLEAGKKVGK